MSDINTHATSEPPLSSVVAAYADLANMRTIRDLLVDTNQDPSDIAAADELIADRWKKMANADVRTMNDVEMLAGALWSRPGEFTKTDAADALFGMISLMKRLWLAIDAGGASGRDALADAMIFAADDQPPRASVPIVRRA